MNGGADTSSSTAASGVATATSWLQPNRVRVASHAGSWYASDAHQLGAQIDDWLSAASNATNAARAIISPHAGYSYCGSTAAYAYNQIAPEKVKRVFILGPSHVVFLSGCALTTCARYATPFGELTVDATVNAELATTDAFEPMDRRNEEAEHSIEMQLPFIARVMGSRSFTIVPILVGSLSTQRQVAYGKILARYVADPHNLFIISSDFCHWGSRFHYTPHSSASSKPIHEQIAALDERAMNAISTLQPCAFNEYLKETQNTICGRNPINVLLQASDFFRQMNNHTTSIEFLKYSQSNKCRSVNDSSVSYAAGVLFMNAKR